MAVARLMPVVPPPAVWVAIAVWAVPEIAVQPVAAPKVLTPVNSSAPMIAASLAVLPVRLVREFAVSTLKTGVPVVLKPARRWSRPQN